MSPSDFDQWLVVAPRRCLVMGVLNVTPDSFSDGGQFAETAAAVAHAETMIADGADLLDIGGESTRPGSDPVSADEQIRRVEPVIRAIRQRSDIAISIDTTRADVAAAAMDAGANLVNDVSGATDDPAMLTLVARECVPIVLMHARGKPKTMQDDPRYDDVAREVSDYLRDRIEAAQRAGISTQKILIDPGIGFGKGIDHNLRLLKQLSVVASLGYPMLLGTSRKRFIGRITGEADAGKREFGTAATVAWCVANGAAIVRVHDVGPMRAVVKMVEAILRA